MITEALSPLRQKLEEKLRSFPGERDITKLVEDKKAEPGHLLDYPAYGPFIAGFDELVDEPRSGHEPGADTLAACFEPQGCRKAAFPRACLPDEDDVSFSLM